MTSTRAFFVLQRSRSRFSAVFLTFLSVFCSPFQVMAKRSRSPLSLSVEGWTSESVAENDDRSRPGRKKLKLSLSKKKNSERFEFISGAKVETLGKKFVPQNTESSTKWALTNYLLWRDKRNATFSDKPSEQVPQDLLASKDAAEIIKWFTFYVAETRRLVNRRLFCFLVQLTSKFHIDLLQLHR